MAASWSGWLRRERWSCGGRIRPRSAAARRDRRRASRWWRWRVGSGRRRGYPVARWGLGFSGWGRRRCWCGRGCSRRRRGRWRRRWSRSDFWIRILWQRRACCWLPWCGVELDCARSQASAMRFFAAPEWQAETTKTKSRQDALRFSGQAGATRDKANATYPDTRGEAENFRCFLRVGFGAWACRRCEEGRWEPRWVCWLRGAWCELRCRCAWLVRAIAELRFRGPRRRISRGASRREGFRRGRSCDPQGIPFPRTRGLEFYWEGRTQRFNYITVFPSATWTIKKHPIATFVAQLNRPQRV